MSTLIEVMLVTYPESVPEVDPWTAAKRSCHRQVFRRGHGDGSRTRTEGSFILVLADESTMAGLQTPPCPVRAPIEEPEKSPKMAPLY